MDEDHLLEYVQRLQVHVATEGETFQVDDGRIAYVVDTHALARVSTALLHVFVVVDVRVQNLLGGVLLRVIP